MKELQALIKDIYYQKDLERGVDKTVIWMISEIGELADIIAKTKNLSEDSIAKENLELELADCIAWLLSIANLLDIDVERAFLKKYPNACSRCNSNPCICQ